MEPTELSKLQAKLDATEVALEKEKETNKLVSQILSIMIFKVQRMRNSQSQFFKTKNPVDLKNSKAYEKDVDDYTRLMKARGYSFKEEKPDQNTLF